MFFIKLIKIWEKIGKQPLRIMQRKDAIMFINNKEYEITGIRYDNGKFIGFEGKQIWFSEKDKPKRDKMVIVRDNSGEEYQNHQWNGICWYRLAGCDGYPSDINVVSWRYQNKE